MKHPHRKKNLLQAEYLANCKPEDKRFHELVFMIGNATFRYHLQAKKITPTIELWNNWLEVLPDSLKAEMKEKGFSECIGLLSFNTYLKNLGLEEYLKKNIDPKDFQEYKDIIG